MSDDNDETDELDIPLTILKTQHSKERKEMKAKVTALKHAIPKNNVKKKKEIMREIEQIEDEMEKRHSKQLLELDNSLKSNENPITTEEKKDEELNKNTIDDSICNFFKEIKLSKSQQKKENKRKEQENKRLVAVQKDEKSAIYSKSYKENEAIKQLLKQRKLKLKDIQPDGDCLYKAISHQLFILNGLKYSAEELRAMAAKYIKKNKQEFLMYLIDSEGKLIDENSFDDYCSKVKCMCFEGGDWGGEPEIRALSDVLQVCVNVLHADGTINEFGDYLSKTLLITYHRHTYSLGEHYNSTEPASTPEFDEFD